MNTNQTEKMVETMKEIAEYLKMFDPASIYEIESTEDDDLVVNFYTDGFDWVKLSGLQDIAKKNNMKVGFNVEPYSQKAIRLTIILSRGE